MKTAASGNSVSRITPECESVERVWISLRSMPRSRLYPFLGVALALGAPVGLLFARTMAAGGHVPTFAWILAEVRQLLVTYAYVTFSTVSVFAVLGYVLGRWFDCVRFLSITDPLTGLFNRRHFEQRLAEEMSRGRRHGHATCVLSIDIDRMKAINDGFGHKAGDHALVTVCRTLLRNVRAADAVARVGGDEFAVLLPETSAAQASVLSQRILAEVTRHGDALTWKLAVSIGIAELNATSDVGSDDILDAADAALYRAKAAGGAHVAVARPEPVTSRSRHLTLMKSALLIENQPRIRARR